MRYDKRNEFNLYYQIAKNKYTQKKQEIMKILSESDAKSITLKVMNVVKTIIKQKDNAINIDFADTKKSLTNDFGFDSLDIAQLSALLEESLDSDPFSEGLILLTIDEIVNFYIKNSSSLG
ncbi:MAG: hypothetical protein KAU62_15960 [Candidatus Heimdallarchaeota archaeon]|nr:hypothetical protein [Candidatus Heimdallarchaeota archaeon]MCK4612652.1 hypothetical protein [Candidatus Heimdallarchaeota archaeon]